MSRGGGWVAASLAHLIRPASDVPLHVRLDWAGCAASPSEPEQAAEARVAAVLAADTAARHLRAGNLRAALTSLEAAVVATVSAAAARLDGRPL